MVWISRGYGLIFFKSRWKVEVLLAAQIYGLDRVLNLDLTRV